ncbi:MAG: hypothetical protein OEL66_01860 [Desulfobulbaceae bacterium]|nr:hypothetical protein [Desulfobulbaceae bacterium]
MRVKPITIALALLALTFSACSNESGKATTTEEKTPTTIVSQAVAADNQMASLTNKSAKNEAAGCSTILESHCTSCHHTTRICQKLGRKNAKGWKRTIKNMVRHGVQITAAETDALVQCLDQQSPEVKEHCQ